MNTVSHNSDQQDRVMSAMHVRGGGVNNCFLIAFKAHSRGGNTCPLTADPAKNPWLWILHPVKPQPLNQLLLFLINGRSIKFPSKLTSLYYGLVQWVVANNVAQSSKVPRKCPVTNRTSIPHPYPKAREPQWKTQGKYSKSQRWGIPEQKSPLDVRGH